LTLAGFGFTPPENGDGNSPDFAAIFAALQSQMQSQFGQFSSENLLNNFQQSGQALPAEVVRSVSKKFISSVDSNPIGTTDIAQTREAMEIADLWLNEATVFPAHANEKNVYSRAEWADATLAGWQLTVEPLAEGLAHAMTQIIEKQELPPEAMAVGPAAMGAVAGMLRTFIGTLIATQLGQCIGGLALNVTGAHDVGLPLLTSARPALLPQNITKWSEDLGVPDSEIRIFHALREGAVARLFDNNPWLVDYMRSAIADYGKGIRIDIEKIQTQAQDAIESGAIDPSNPETFSIALNEGLFTPDESPVQRNALAKLETALALIDGWADDVTITAAAGRLPSLESLRETTRRRRATSSPAQQLFSSLFGLEVSPRMSREASAFWQQLRELRDVATRDQIWSGILPTHDELTDVAAYLRSVEVPDDLSGLNP